MGMISLFLMMMALRTRKKVVQPHIKENRQEPEEADLASKEREENILKADRCACLSLFSRNAPAVARVGHVQLPQQVNDSQGRAAAGDAVDLLLPLDLDILGAKKERRRGVVFFFTFDKTLLKKKEGVEKALKERKKENKLPRPPTCDGRIL